MSKKTFIDSVKVGSACGEKWENMAGGELVRFCSHCAKDVNNLSRMTRKEAARFVRSSDGNLCIRYIVDPRTRAPMFAQPLLQITRRAPGIAAGVMTASMGLSTLSYAQSDAPSTPVPEPTAVARQDDRVAGKAVEQPDTPASTRTLTGTITDPNGAVIANASVTISGMGGTHTVTTNGEGVYRVEGLAEGKYQMEAMSNGFHPNSRLITITGGENAVADSTLDVARIDLTVEVKADVEMEYAVMGGAISVVEYRSELASAVGDEDIEAVRDLIVKGAKVNAKEESYSKITPLFIAVETGNIEITEMLLNFGAKVNARDTDKQTPLMRLDEDATPELVGLLIRHGAKIDLKDKEGNTALILAAGRVNAEVLQALVSAGADLNIRNKAGQTALMNAADSDLLESVRLLLVAGAKVDLKNVDGETAYDLTSEEEIEQLLVSHGAEVDQEEPVSSDDPADEPPA